MVAYCSLTSSYCEQRCHSVRSAFGFYQLWCKGSKLLNYISPDLIYRAVNNTVRTQYENTDKAQYYDIWCVRKYFSLYHLLVARSASFWYSWICYTFFRHHSHLRRFWFHYFWDSCRNLSALVCILFSGVFGTNHTNKNSINMHLNLFISFIPLFIISSVVGTFTLLKDSFYNHKER